MTTQFFKLSFFISIVAFVLASCNNEPAFNKLNENESAKNELLKTAKEIVQQHNDTDIDKIIDNKNCRQQTFRVFKQFKYTVIARRITLGHLIEIFSRQRKECHL